MSKFNNVRKHRPLALLSPVQRLMFCAHDEAEHTLTYGFVAKRWMLENKHVGLVRTHVSLISGLSDLERVSGNNSDNFTLTDNPYG